MGSLSKPLFAAGVACFAASAAMAVGFSLRYWLPVLIHYDWACYVSRMFLLPGETCETFEQAAIVLTWLAIPFGAAGLALMGRFRAGITPIVQRVCFWSVIMVFSVGTVVNLGYALLPRGSTTLPPTAAALLLYAPVAFLVVIIVMFGMVRRPRSPGGAC